MLCRRYGDFIRFPKNKQKHVSRADQRPPRRTARQASVRGRRRRRACAPSATRTRVKATGPRRRGSRISARRPSVLRGGPQPRRAPLCQIIYAFPAERRAVIRPPDFLLDAQNAFVSYVVVVFLLFFFLHFCLFPSTEVVVVVVEITIQYCIIF